MGKDSCQVKLVFGILFLLVGLYAIAGDLGYVAKTVSFWSLLVTLFGLAIIAKSKYCKK